MWTFFKTLFNILRNISLAIVLAVVGCFAWIWTDEELKEGLVEAINEERSLANETYSEDEEVFGIQSFTNEDNASKISKIEIKKANGGSLYLTPDEIMYLNKHGDDEYLITNDNEKIRTNISLINEYRKLERFGEFYFFKTKNNIINCEMIRGITPENKNELGNNYVYKIEMKNGDIINVNKNKIADLRRIMDKISN